MRPSMHLRWLVRENKVTAEEVKAERDISGDSLMKCKERLANRQAPVLQQFWIADQYGDPCPHRCDYDSGEWRDVVVHVEPNALGQGSADCGASPAPTGCASNGSTEKEE